MLTTIDHSLLSPSGRMSKAARERALTREAERLFDGVDIRPKGPAQPTEREAMLQQAARLRDLAARGMHPRKYVKEAERLEFEAAHIVDGR